MPVSTQIYSPHASSPLGQSSSMHGRKPASNPSGGRPLIPSSSSVTHVNGNAGLRDDSNEPTWGRSSETMSGAESVIGEGKIGKKGKRKGWKGWALVLEDEDGNVIDVKPGGEAIPTVTEVSGGPTRGESIYGAASGPSVGRCGDRADLVLPPKVPQQEQVIMLVPSGFKRVPVPVISIVSHVSNFPAPYFDFPTDFVRL